MCVCFGSIIFALLLPFGMHSFYIFFGMTVQIYFYCIIKVILIYLFVLYLIHISIYGVYVQCTTGFANYIGLIDVFSDVFRRGYS